MRRLLLLRHAKAEPAGNGPDFDRTLASRGRANASSMGAYLKEKRLVPDVAAISPARRTIETWDRLTDEFSGPKPIFDARIYDASDSTLLSVVHDMPARAHLAMLVGHNPGLARLAYSLSGGGAKDALERMAQKFPTCALAVIDFADGTWKDIAPGDGKLKSFVMPADFDKS